MNIDCVSCDIRHLGSLSGGDVFAFGGEYWMVASVIDLHSALPEYASNANELICFRLSDGAVRLVKHDLHVAVLPKAKLVCE